MQIPVIDIRALTPRGDPRELSDVVDAIGVASREFGFFQVVGHELSEELLARVWCETHWFFDLPREQKLAISRTAENPRGYYDRELTKNARDLKEVFDFSKVPFADLPENHPKNRAAVDGFNQWPNELPSFRPTMLEYFDACVELGLQLLGALCLGLGAERDRLADYFMPLHTSFVRLNFYPLDDPLQPEDTSDVTPLGDMALHHHTDAGALTILLQDEVGGLQVFANDRWIDVEPTDGALVINVGDMMQLWSNDRFRAALHRVLPRENRARYSIPFFFNPSYETDCVPLEPLQDGGARYREVNWGRFREQRTAGDFADYGKEIQLADFRIE